MTRITENVFDDRWGNVPARAVIRKIEHGKNLKGRERSGHEGNPPVVSARRDKHAPGGFFK
ncbi:MAG: hypothetical protein QOE33_425 [Acidobacteriota bacterium]|nr:hypothetical protein [Acidobacteriota bacterium]